VLAIGDNIVSFFFKTRTYPWIAAFIRPLLLIAQFQMLRTYVFRYLRVIYVSSPMVLLLFTFIFFFSCIGKFYFAGTLQGVQYMNDLSDSSFNMMVLMTTSNYPDVMLPAYQQNRFNFIFFGTYLLLGMFFIMNLLLAIIYSNFKSYFEQQIENKEDIRRSFLFDKFQCLAKETDHLDKIQMYKFFVLIHSLVAGCNQDQFEDDEDLQISRDLSKKDDTMSDGGSSY